MMEITIFPYQCKNKYVELKIVDEGHCSSCRSLGLEIGIVRVTDEVRAMVLQRRPVQERGDLLVRNLPGIGLLLLFVASIIRCHFSRCYVKT